MTGMRPDPDKDLYREEIGELLNELIDVMNDMCEWRKKNRRLFHSPLQRRASNLRRIAAELELMADKIENPQDYV